MAQQREQAGALDPTTEHLERARDALGGRVGDAHDDVSRPHHARPSRRFSCATIASANSAETPCRLKIARALVSIAAAEQRLVRRIAQVEDDALVAALKAEWASTKTTREAAEQRLAELEGIERDLQADRAEVEALAATWQSWQAILGAAAAEGSVPADLQAKARQILKKVLVAPIMVKPNAPGDWSFAGYSRFEGVVSGGLTTSREQITIITHPYVDAAGRKVLYNPLFDSATGEGRDLPPISGGSDLPLVGGSPVRDTDMAPHTPHRSDAPRQSRGAPW